MYSHETKSKTYKDYIRNYNKYGSLLILQVKNIPLKDRTDGFITLMPSHQVFTTVTVGWRTKRLHSLLCQMNDSGFLLLLMPFSCVVAPLTYIKSLLRCVVEISVCVCLYWTEVVKCNKLEVREQRQDIEKYIYEFAVPVHPAGAYIPHYKFSSLSVSARRKFFIFSSFLMFSGAAACNFFQIFSCCRQVQVFQ